MNLNELPQNAGVLICGHGSRAKLAAEEFSSLPQGLQQRYPSLNIAYGFLEYSSPNIHMALDELLAKGVNKIYAVPGMLFSATHARNDIPSVLTTYQEKHPGLTIEYGRELGLHDEMIKAFQARILDALGLKDSVQDEMPEPGSLYDTMLIVVGRGTSVTAANAEAAKLTRTVCENLGFGWSETVYSGVTFPSVGRGIEMACKLGFKKIVIAPYFLFGGRLIERIKGYVNKVAEEHPDITFMTADYLRDQEHVINTFIERIGETISEPEPTLSLMEDFQARLARGEVDVHHHHAEFQPHEHEHEHDKAHEHGHSHEPDNRHDHNSDAKHPHAHDHEPADKHEHKTDHNHAKGHSHGHSHAPYRHIAHTHGPRTMINENICCCFMSQFPQYIIDEEMKVKPVRPGTPSCKRPGG